MRKLKLTFVASGRNQFIRNYLQDSARAEVVGKNAQHFVQSNFDMSVMVEKTIDFYKRLLEE